MTKIPQTISDLEKHLQEQLSFLSLSADAYDVGYEAEAKRMAAVLRVLLHDGDDSKSNSKSLLGLLGIKESTKFYDSAVFEKNAVNMGASLIVIPGGGNGKAIPFLDDSPPETVGYSNFDEYWNKPVLFTNNKHFTRKDLVKFVTDQDGGANVDPQLDEAYSKLSREHAFGWSIGSPGSANIPVSIVELASIRQIAHEILRTFVPNYPKKMLLKKVPLMYPRIFFEKIEKEDDDENNTIKK